MIIQPNYQLVETKSSRNQGFPSSKFFKPGK